MAGPTSRTPASYDRDQAEAARQATLETMHNQLAEKVGSLDSLQAWGAWLRFANSFHRYSFNNTLLIWAQKPDATMVAGYRAWQARGRQVRRGETSIKVYGPVTTREPKTDPNGHPIRDTDGKPVHEVRIVGVKPVSAFLAYVHEPEPLMLAHDRSWSGRWRKLQGETLNWALSICAITIELAVPAKRTAIQGH